MRTYFNELLIRLRADAAKAHKSMTIWFNAAAGAAAVGLPLAQEQLPPLQDYVPAGFYHYLMGAVVAGNIVLRFKTRSALADKP